MSHRCERCGHHLAVHVAFGKGPCRLTDCRCECFVADVATQVERRCREQAEQLRAAAEKAPPSMYKMTAFARVKVLTEVLEWFEDARKQASAAEDDGRHR